MQKLDKVDAMTLIERQKQFDALNHPNLRPKEKAHVTTQLAALQAEFKRRFDYIVSGIEIKVEDDE